MGAVEKFLPRPEKRLDETGLEVDHPFGVFQEGSKEGGLLFVEVGVRNRNATAPSFCSHSDFKSEWTHFLKELAVFLDQFQHGLMGDLKPIRKNLGGNNGLTLFDLNESVIHRTLLLMREPPLVCRSTCEGSRNIRATGFPMALSLPTH